ncbi:MAG TPA: SPOR domain-containing protein [Fulvivirga sp.]|nr:SPOR domain-containing protein [Fulvivirga sp.]
MIKNLKYCLIVSLAIYSCSPSATTSTSSVETYSEDISVLRPSFEEAPDNTKESIATKEKIESYPEPKHDVTKQLNSVLDSIDRIKANINFVDGYTVQVYSGINSEEAKIARGKVYSLIPDAAPILKYDEPNFKVKVGKFYSRLEAQKTYYQLKKRFPSAIIIPERIYIN